MYMTFFHQARDSDACIYIWFEDRHPEKRVKEMRPSITRHLKTRLHVPLVCVVGQNCCYQVTATAVLTLRNCTHHVQ